MIICPLLMQGQAASMSTNTSSPVDCVDLVLKGSACIGSRCAWWASVVTQSNEAQVLDTDEDGCPHGKCGMTMQREHSQLTPGTSARVMSFRDPAWTPPPKTE